MILTFHASAFDTCFTVKTPQTQPQKKIYHCAAVHSRLQVWPFKRIESPNRKQEPTRRLHLPSNNLTSGHKKKDLNYSHVSTKNYGCIHLFQLICPIHDKKPSESGGQQAQKRSTTPRVSILEAESQNAVQKPQTKKSHTHVQEATKQFARDSYKGALKLECGDPSFVGVKQLNFATSSSRHTHTSKKECNSTQSRNQQLETHPHLQKGVRQHPISQPAPRDTPTPSKRGATAPNLATSSSRHTHTSKKECDSTQSCNQQLKTHPRLQKRVVCANTPKLEWSAETLCSLESNQQKKRR
jgi:hypothetical protein